MSDSKLIVGELGQCDHPNWKPLLAIVGELLAAEFMWMSQIDLADGGTMHAYKHALTRQYMHVAEDGRTLAFVRSGRYLQIEAGAALVQAFDGWERFAEERPDLEDALRAAYRNAGLS